MAKEITGYFRTVPGGLAIAGVSVSLLHEDTGGAVPTGGMWALATNPVTSDANGKFTFTSELSPGPVRVEGTSGGEKKVRSGFETMQTADVFVSDFSYLGQLYTNGVITGKLNQLSASTTGTRQAVIATGYAVVEGRIWGIDTTRTLTHAANGTLTERWDLIVLEQHVGSTYKGRQNLAIVQGTVNQVDPAINADPNIKQVAIHRAKIANGATSVVLVDLRTYASPVSIGDGTIVDADISASAAIDPTKIAPGTVSSTELGYLDGTTSSVQTQLNGKSATGHTHAESDTTNLVTDLAGKAATGHTHAEADTTSLVADLALKAPLASPTFTGTVTAANLTATGNVNLGDSTNDLLTLTGHLTATGSPPSIAANSAAGTGPSAAIVFGNDTFGLLRLITGTSPGVGNLFTVTHLVGRTSASYAVLLVPANDNASGYYGSMYADNAAFLTGSFPVKARLAPAASTTYLFFYFIFGG